MFQYPEKLYTDVRIETKMSTNIALENGRLVRNKTKSEKGAMIRVYDGEKWYYNAITDISNIQRAIDELASLAELTGNASCGYDDVPMLGGCLLNIEKSNKTLKELLDGRLGLVVHVSSGGDFTAAGDYAAPVQLAYLTDGEKLIGRLPECNISGNIFDLLGKDYIGYSKDKDLMDHYMFVTKVKIS